MGLKTLFGLNQQASVQTSTSIASTTVVNPDTKQDGETYEHWGLRMCGVVSGSLTALLPLLQKVYNCIYKEQVANKELQQQLVINMKVEIAQKETEVKALQKKCENKEAHIEKMQGDTKELKDERKGIKTGKKRVNYEHMPALVIGLIILIPLTCYLFLFYSSTFYSAFFRNAEDMDGVANAMFAANALSNAYSGGMTELLFVLLAPIIFLGLGFILHVFSEHKKYMQTAGILLVTVMFDCILAFKIGEQLHIFNIIIGNVPIGTPYGMKEAVGDINTWAVIFCGFIAYVIWGIVFDSVMSASKKMDFNKTRVKEIDKDIQKKEGEIASAKADIDGYEDSMSTIKKDIDKLTQGIGRVVNIDYSAIKTEINNFYTGWIIQMKVLSCTQKELADAKDIYDNMIQSIDRKASEMI